MNDLDFYKSLYDYEINRRYNLDKSINAPIIIISILIGAISYLLTSIDIGHSLVFSIIIIAVIVASSILIFMAIICLAKSYNNFFKGFAYVEIPLPSEIRLLQIKKLPEYNKKVKSSKKRNFEVELIDQLTGFTDNYYNINIKRSLYLHFSKSMIIGALIIIVIGLVVCVLKIHLI